MHVYVADDIFVRVIVVPETPVPDNTPPSPQSTSNVPAADNAKLNVVCPSVVVKVNFASAFATPIAQNIKTTVANTHDKIPPTNRFIKKLSFSPIL